MGCADDPGRGAVMEARDGVMNPGEVGGGVKGRGTTESGGGGPSGSLPACLLKPHKTRAVGTRAGGLEIISVL